MRDRLVRHLAALAAFASLLGCGGSLVPARPTETVRVVGSSADALGRTIEVDGRGFVHVELHEGPLVWVEPSQVAPAALAPGASLVARDATGALFIATLAESLDRVLTVVRADGTRQLVALDHVIAVAHAPIAADATQPEITTTVTPPPPPPSPPPPDPRRFATRPTGAELLERVRVVSCTGGSARILGDGGTLLTVPVRDLRPLRAQVGDHVHALWQSGETAYAAIVLALEGRLVSVRYEDGTEEWVQGQQIVRREATSGGGGAGACPSGREGFAMVRRGPMRRVVEVASCEAGRAVVHAPGEETTATVALSELRELAVPAGARVEVLWHQSSPYVGTTGATQDGSVDVHYEDGSEEPAPLTDLRWVASDFEAEPYLCPPG